MPRRTSLRSRLYRAARDLSKPEAVDKDPDAFAKRMVRRRSIERSTSGRDISSMTLVFECQPTLR
jgi:hypothetical protein